MSDEAISGAAFSMSPGLLFGLMLIAAIAGGYAARLLHVPRVVGYVLAGIALHESLALAFLGERLSAAAGPLDAIRDLALGLILFTIGRVFDRSQLRSTGRRGATLGAGEMACTAALVIACCLVVALLTQPELGTARNAVLAVLLGLAAIATAPAATLFVLQEYEAKGPITDTILTLTGLNNVVCIVLFYAAFLVLAVLGAVESSASLSQHLGLALLAAIPGSVVLGLVCGVAMSILYARLRLGEMLLFFFALFLLLGAGEKWLVEHRFLSFNFLLTSLVMGAVFANVAIDSDKLTGALRTFGAPIFAGFFVMAGFGLHLEDLLHMGWLGAAYVLGRSAGKVLGCRLGIGRGVTAPHAPEQLGGALLCQAAVVIGLAAFVQRNWQDPPLARQFATVVLGSVVVFEFVGPLLVKRCVVAGGEVKVITLLSRGGAAAERAPILGITLRALARALGLRRPVRRGGRRVLTAAHVMRANVQLIPASADFGEVLHFIERSRHDHFPVVSEGGDFAGMIHFSDIGDVIYDPVSRDLITALDLADPASVVVPMDLPLGALHERFARHRVGVLPVVERDGSRRIVGLVEQRDLLRALHPEASGQSR